MEVRLTLASFLASFAFVSSFISSSSSDCPEISFIALDLVAAGKLAWRGNLFGAWERDGAGRFGGMFESCFSRLES